MYSSLSEDTSKATLSCSLDSPGTKDHSQHSSFDENDPYAIVHGDSFRDMKWSPVPGEIKTSPAAADVNQSSDSSEGETSGFSSDEDVANDNPKSAEDEKMDVNDIDSSSESNVLDLGDVMEGGEKKFKKKK